VCISTQVIEAGVDISFERVIRLSAGMDSVVQSAGRCNRNGESSEPVPVYLIQCADENLGKLREIQMGKDACLGLVREFQRSPERFHHALDSHESIKRYYQLLYGNMDEGYQDFSVQKGKRKLTLLSLLSDNSSFYDEDSPFAGQCQLNQAFRLAGSRFTVFDQDTTDVIVPYREGEQYITELGSVNPQHQPQRFAQLLEAAKPYTVSLYAYQRKKLEDEGALVPLWGGSVLVLQEGHYDNKTGLVTQSGEKRYLEV
jgi:CRISPR-associated endonuclease/helicase Cas3